MIFAVEVVDLIAVLYSRKQGLFMIVVDHVYLSDDVAEEYFVCALEACQGACCVEGDVGAPLESKEIETIARLYPRLAHLLAEEARQIIAQQGFYLADDLGEYTTPTLPTGECVYAVRHASGQLQCAFELLHRMGETDFVKPISCHLYPLRITRYDQFEAVNYHRWHICQPACLKGKETKVPLYRFLRESLIRKYGISWYESLCRTIEEQFGKD